MVEPDGERMVDAVIVDESSEADLDNVDGLENFLSHDLSHDWALVKDEGGDRGSRSRSETVFCRDSLRISCGVGAIL